MSPKPGYTTTEFWIVVLTHVSALITLVFHQDFSGAVQGSAVVLAALVGGIYSIARSHVKATTLRASAAVRVARADAATAQAAIASATEASVGSAEA